MKKNLLLEIKNLITSFNTDEGLIKAVEDVSFKLFKGETLGIVGESGCGKSVTALSILRLLPRPMAKIESGKVILNGTDLTKLDPDKMYEIRGKKISMIFQEPMTALNPVHKIGDQIREIINLHFKDLSDKEVNVKILSLLKRVGIPDPEKRINEYPHQLSGGMRQRIIIAIALACEPEILIADEPTTALDVTIQAQILDLIKELKKENDMSVIFITHDLGVIAEMCDYVVVMYAGKIAEKAPVNSIFKNPKHPYTQGLLSSIPKLENKRKTKLNIIKGIVPSLYDLPTGCRFQNRCPHAFERCRLEEPPLYKLKNDQYSSCFLIVKMQVK